MTKKNIVLFSTIILILCSAGFFYKVSTILNKDTDFVEKKQPVNNQVIANNKKSSKTHQATKNLIDVSYVDADINTLNSMHSSCGHGVHSNVYGDIVEMLSDKQNLAFSDLLDKCEKWYDFINNLSNEQLDLQNKAIKEHGDHAVHLLELNINSNRKLIVEESRKALNNNFGFSNLSRVALENLLKHDYVFMREIAKNIGTKNINFFSDNSKDIAFLYICEVAPQECSQKSILMLSMCLTNENMCNFSYPHYYATTVTQNQFADMINTIHAIKMLIQQGYFD